LKTLEYYLQYTKPNGDCLEWQRCFSTEGYPREGFKGNSNVKVHREVFNIVNGYYPPVVRHKCDNTKCINPDHLEGGTAHENLQDRINRKRCGNYKSQELVDEVIRLRKSGMKLKHIAATLNQPYKVIDYIVYSCRKAKG